MALFLDWARRFGVGVGSSTQFVLGQVLNHGQQDPARDRQSSGAMLRVLILLVSSAIGTSLFFSTPTFGGQVM